MTPHPSPAYRFEEARILLGQEHHPAVSEAPVQELAVEVRPRADVLLTFKNTQLPGIAIIDSEAAAGDSFTLLHEEDKHQGVIYLNFLLNGQIRARQYGTNALDVQLHQHNILYAPAAGSSETRLHGQARTFNVKLDELYFRNLLPAGEALITPLLEKMERQEPFIPGPGLMRVQAQQLEVVQAIRQCPLKGAFKKIYLEAKVMELLTLQLIQLQGCPIEEKPLRPADAQKFREVKAYLDEHFLEPVSLGQLVRQFGLNDFKLKTGFRQLYQTTVIGYVQGRRLDLARDLLLAGTMNVSQVSDLVGYQHPQHFSAAYKKRFGANPGRFLKQSA